MVSKSLNSRYSLTQTLGKYISWKFVCASIADNVSFVQAFTAGGVFKFYKMNPIDLLHLYEITFLIDFEAKFKKKTNERNMNRKSCFIGQLIRSVMI